MGGPARLLHITSRLNVGGLARLVLALTERLDPTRFHCRLVTGSVAPPEGDLLVVEGRGRVEPFVIPELGRTPHPGHDVVAFWKLLRLIRRTRPRIVHTHAAKAGTLGRLAAVVARVPLVLHSYHGHVFRDYFSPAVSRLIVAVERRLASVTDAIVVPAASQRDEIAGRYRIASTGKIHVIPYGIDVEFFGTPLLRTACRRRLSLPEKARVIAAVGRLAAVKNHVLLVDSVVRLAADPAFDDLHLLVVGDGECRQEIESRVAASGLAKRVHMAGWVADLRAAYGAADVVALTSHNEGMPVAVLEAMAAGVPVVSTRAGGVVDLVHHERTGLLVGTTAPDEFASALRRVLTEPALAADLARRAREHVVSRHSEAAGVQALESLYEVLLTAA